MTSRSSPQQELETLLAGARRHTASAQDDAAKAAYIEILRRDATHVWALNELAALAHASGHRSAARTAYQQAVRFHPDNATSRVNLGTMLYEDGDLAAADAQFQAALAVDASCAEALRGFGRILADRGDNEAANRLWRSSFSGQAVAPQIYRGLSPGVPMLLLVSARGGNIPTRHVLDDRIFAVTVLYAEYYDPGKPLPPHVLVFNAIGDADLCLEALDHAHDIASRTTAPLINRPAHVRATGRAANAARLAGLTNVRAPHIQVLRRADTPDSLRFPLLLRSPGFHTGQHFARVERACDLGPAMAELPGDELLAIEYLDARGADGKARKYRVMVINGQLYPIHLAISADWKVHYFTSDMAQHSAYRDEEERFLQNMPAVLGPNAMAALSHIGKVMGLDYAGIDFALDRDGSVLVFEANATMVINPPPLEAIWDYRRAPITRALEATKQLLLAKSASRMPL